MGKFEVKTEKRGTDLTLTLAGTIDEDADFGIIDVSGAAKISIDFNGVKGINSCGIREWMKWLGVTKAAQLAFLRCPKIVVDQINMVDGFLPKNAKMESFYVPYYNEESGIEKNVLFRYGNEFVEGKVTPPAQVLDDHGHPMDMDILEAKYFRFINK